MFDVSFFNVPEGCRLGVWTARADALYARDHIIDTPFYHGDILLLKPDGSLQDVGSVAPVRMPEPGADVLDAMDWLVG